MGHLLSIRAQTIRREFIKTVIISSYPYVLCMQNGSTDRVQLGELSVNGQ